MENMISDTHVTGQKYEQCIKRKRIHEQKKTKNGFSASQTILVAGGTTLSEFCCMVRWQRKKWYHFGLFFLRGGATSTEKVEQAMGL